MRKMTKYKKRKIDFGLILRGEFHKNLQSADNGEKKNKFGTEKKIVLR